MSRRSSISERRDDILESVKAEESPKCDEARQSRQRLLTQHGYLMCKKGKFNFFAKKKVPFKERLM